MSSIKNEISKFILLKNQTAHEKSRSSYLVDYKNVNALKGSLWYSAELLVEASLVNLKSVDQDLTLKCPANHVSKISEIEYEFLLAIPSCKERYSFYVIKNKELYTAKFYYEYINFSKSSSQNTIRVKVFYSENFKDSMTGNLRFINRIAKYKGYWLGIDLDEEMRNKSLLSSSGCILPEDNTHFMFKFNCGILVTLNRIEFLTDPSELDKIVQLLELGDRVMWVEDDHLECGVVRWCKVLEEVPNQYSYGIECDNPLGRGTGMFNGVQVFRTKNKHARIMPACSLAKVEVPVDANLATNITTPIPLVADVVTSITNENNIANVLCESNVAGEDSMKSRGHCIAGSIGSTVVQESRANRDQDFVCEPTKLSSKKSKSLSFTSHPSDKLNEWHSDEPACIPMSEMNKNSNERSFMYERSLKYGNTPPHMNPKENVANVNKPFFSPLNKQTKDKVEEYKLRKSADDVFSDTSEVPTGAKLSFFRSPTKPNVPMAASKENKLLMQKIEIHSMVQVEIPGMSLPQKGVVRWMGTIAKEQIVGIELEDECLAATDGRFMNKQLFTCAPKKGYFTKLSRVRLDDRFAHFPSVSTPSSEYSFGGLECLEVLERQNCLQANNYKELTSIIQRCLSKQVQLGTHPSVPDEKASSIRRAVQCTAEKQPRPPQPQTTTESSSKRTSSSSSSLSLSDIERETFDEVSRRISSNQQPNEKCTEKNKTHSINDDHRQQQKHNLSTTQQQLHPRSQYPQQQQPQHQQQQYQQQQHQQNIFQHSQVLTKLQGADVMQRRSDESLDETINIAGRNLGIQGHHNSCYLDASLFAMFTFNDCFDSMLYRSRNVNDINSYDEIQKTLRDGIVHPLRLNLYVRADKVMQLRQLISDVSRNYGFLNQEKDPEEFLHCLFKETLKLTPLLQFNTGLQNYTVQLLVDDPLMTSSQMSSSASTPTLAQLLEASMQKFNLKFTKLPRFGIKKMYKRIIPLPYLNSKNLILTNNSKTTTGAAYSTTSSANYVLDKQLNKVRSSFESPQVKPNDSDDNDGDKDSDEGTDDELFKFDEDDDLLEDAPSDVYVSPGMKNISPLSLNLIQSSTDTTCNTSNDYILELFAVVCIKTSHYVSFTKCGYKQESPWLFFDSMSDRIDSGHGYNIPGIRICEEVTEFLTNESFRNRLESIPDESLSEELKRFLCDGYICFYRSQKPI